MRRLSSPSWVIEMQVKEKRSGQLMNNFIKKIFSSALSLSSLVILRYYNLVYLKDIEISEWFCPFTTEDRGTGGKENIIKRNSIFF